MGIIIKIYNNIYVCRMLECIGNLLIFFIRVAFLWITIDTLIYLKL